jgi:prepilin-type N-terminal cleavage/methylation domain-containing protein
MSRRTGFTLIELLIVVAIIAILAAIAVPNFLEAQTRAKVSRTKADMRSMATALEAYYVDHNSYPHSGTFNHSIFAPGDNPNVFPPNSAGGTVPLSTPIAYITNAAMADPFAASMTDSGTPIPTRLYVGFQARDQINGFVANDTSGSMAYWWTLDSAGPDIDTDSYQAFNQSDDAISVEMIADVFYDPTNGTVSNGNIWRIGGSPIGQGAAAGRFIEANDG